MYEEDRQYALEMYERMFDSARDEQLLLQLLVSPTKQAVIVARAYNSREHKLQVEAQSKKNHSEFDEGTQEYVAAIERIRQAAIVQGLIAPEVTAGQFSLFEDDGQGQTERYYGYEAYAPAAEVSAWLGEKPALVPAAEAAPAEKAAPVSAEEPDVEAAPAPAEAEKAPAPDEAAAEGFVLPRAEPDMQPVAESSEAEQEPAPEAEAEPESRENAAAPAEGEFVRKPKVFLLILYVIFAVPITVLCIALLLIPTLLFLSLSISVIASGVLAFSAAFSGFTVLADIMVVFGAALVILALGLLFFWIFVWFVGGAIVGLVRSVIELGGKWCYKEVPAA